MIRLVASCLLGAAPFASVAHHSFPTVYDAARRTTIEGVVTEIWYQNPHARLYVRVDDGRNSIWEIETQSPNMLRRGGWRFDSVKVGDRIKVEGNLAHTIEYRMYLQNLTFADGSVLWVQDPAPLREN